MGNGPPTTLFQGGDIIIHPDISTTHLDLGATSFSQVVSTHSPGKAIPPSSAHLAICKALLFFWRLGQRHGQNPRSERVGAGSLCRLFFGGASSPFPFLGAPKVAISMHASKLPTFEEEFR